MCLAKENRAAAAASASDGNSQAHNKPLPELFRCKAWRELNHSVLSTSNCGNPSLRLFGFGPVVDDGYGIGYIIKDNGLSFCVSSKNRQTGRYLGMLRQTILLFRMALENPEASTPIRIRSKTIAPEVSSAGGYGFFDAGDGS